MVEIRRIYILIIFFLIPNIIIQFPSNHQYLVSYSEIILKIKGNGQQRILGQYYNICPDEVHINSVKSEEDLCDFVNLEGEENTIKLVFYENFVNCRELFRDIVNATEIDLSNFDTSSTIDMGYMFSYCTSLTSVKLSGLNVESVYEMSGLFYGCDSLVSVDFSDLKTLSLNSTKFMFNNCKSLKNVNMSNFDTSNVVDMKYMFNGCESLTSLDLSNFDTTLVTSMIDMFTGCNNLEYINMTNSPDNTKLDISGTANNIVICMNNQQNQDLTSSLSNGKCGIIDCSENFRENQKKVLADDGSCISSCQDSSENKYEYLNKCYKDCPNGTVANDNFLCEIPKTEKLSTFLIIEDTTYIAYNTYNTYNSYTSYNTYNNQIIFNSLITTNITENTQINIQIKTHTYNPNSLYIKDNNDKTNDEIYKMIKNEIIPNYSTEEGEIITIDGDGITFQVTTDKNEIDTFNGEIENKNNLSMIDLDDCAELLKQEYDIENSTLILLKSENKEKIASERNVQFEVYHPVNKSKLDLSICKNSDINLYIPTKLSEETKKLRKDLKINNYDLFNLNDPFYNDICAKYTTMDKTDILLEDRKNYYFHNNDTICQSNCEFSNYSIENEYLECSCKVINEDIDIENKEKFNPKKLYQSFYDVLKYSNYKVLKCFKLIFISDNIKSNKGSICVLVFFCIYFGFFISTFFIRLTPLRTGLNKIKTGNNIKNANKANNSGKKTNNNKRNKKSKTNKNILNMNKGKRIKNDKKIENINKIKKSKTVRIKKTKMNFPPKKYIKKNIKNKQNKNFNMNLVNNFYYMNKKTENLNSKDISHKKINSKNGNNQSKTNNRSFHKFYTTKNLDIINEKSQDIILINNKSKTSKENKSSKKLDNFELNYLEFNEALILDKRHFCEMYWFLLKREHILLFTFFSWNDYNLFYIKFAKFLFLVCTDMAMNVFFFSDESMHKIFLSYGKYDFIQQIPQIIYSKIVSNLIEVFLCYLTMTDVHFYELKKMTNKNTKKMKSIFNCIKIKLIIFYVFTFMFFFFYWYLVTGFCAVYKNTQMIFIKDSIFSFILGLIIPFPLYLFPSFFRIISLRYKKSKCLYKFSDFLPLY